MPKMKTRKAVAKRFKVTARGKVMHHRARKSHLLSKMNSKSKRQLRDEKEVNSSDLKRIKSMMPYG